MQVIVQRDPADKGIVVEEPILSSELAQLARGTSEIERGFPKTPMTLKCRYIPGIRPGHLLGIVDSLRGQVYRVKVTSIKWQYSMNFQSEIDTSMTLEVARPHAPNN